MSYVHSPRPDVHQVPGKYVGNDAHVTFQISLTNKMFHGAIIFIIPKLFFKKEKKNQITGIS